MIRNELKKVTELKDKFLTKKALLKSIQESIKYLSPFRSKWQIKIWRKGARELKKELTELKRELELRNINHKDL